MLPWFEPEITPPVHVPGIRRRKLNPEDAAASVRALVEGQMMAMALHSRWMGRSPNIIHATGGASANREILQVMADVFDATVVELPSRNSAALGAALRACHADAVADGLNPAWEDIVHGFTDPVVDRRIGPVAANVTTYRHTIARYEEFEREVLGERKRG
jgi:xylulokinase